MSADFEAFLAAKDPEAVMREALSRHLQAAASGPGPTWNPGRPLRILLAGYAGADNTGADIRLIEIIRQLRGLLPAACLDIGVMSLRSELPAEFADVRAEVIDGYFPDQVVDLVARHDVVIVGEGSALTSSFCDTFAMIMAAVLGQARAAGKPAIAYGIEVDEMTPGLTRFVVEQVRGATLITRNPESTKRLADLGLPALTGTDTAWDYEPGQSAEVQMVLASQGWDGKQPLAVVCPHHPFWWPVKPDVNKGQLMRILGTRSPAQFGEFYFHQDTEHADSRYRHYLDALAGALARLRTDGLFPVIVGMERLDETACEDLGALYGRSHATFLAGNHPAAVLVNVLHQARLIVSSRFHALILSLGVGVPSVGLAMDQRIASLMAARGTPDLALNVKEPNLEAALLAALDRLGAQQQALEQAGRRLAERERRRLAAMGRVLRMALGRAYPDLSFLRRRGGQTGLVAAGGWTRTGT